MGFFMQDTFLSSVFIQNQFSNKNSLTYLKSFLIVRDLCKNYGGNLPSLKVLSLATGLSLKTTQRHFNYYLTKGWIKENTEKQGSFTLNKLHYIINVNHTRAAKGVKIPQESYLNTTTQQFTAYLSEAVYTSKHYYHVTKEKDELKKAKSKSKGKIIPNYAFNKFCIDPNNTILLTKSYISKPNKKGETKLRFTYIRKEVYIKNEVRLLKDIIKVKWFDFKNPYSCKSLNFLPYNLKKEVINHLLLKVAELTQVSMTNIQESEEKNFSMQQSLSYRASAISRSKTTVKKYQSWFEERYSKDKFKFISSCGTFKEVERRNSLEAQSGKFIHTSKGLFYSPCTMRTVAKLNIVKKRFLRVKDL